MRGWVGVESVMEKKIARMLIWSEFDFGFGSISIRAILEKLALTRFCGCCEGLPLEQ